MKWNALSAAIVLVASSRIFAQAEFSYWDVERRVVDRLGTVDVSTLAASVAAAPKSTDAGELLFRFEVLVRAGHDAEAIAALDALTKAAPPMRSGIARDLVDSLIDRKDRALALAAFERFPEARAGWGNVLMREWAADVGWEQVDRWASERQPAAPDYWIAERLRIRTEVGKAQELYDALVADAKSHSADLGRFQTLLRLNYAMSPTPDTAWMATTFAPRLAFDAARLGQELHGRPAVILLERALAMPATDEDVVAVSEYVRTHSAMAHPQDNADYWKGWLRTSIRDSLLVAYRAAGDKEKAQELLVALADERPGSNGLPGISLFLAGAVQAESGARVIEGRARAAEPVAEDSPEYWKGRADYYRGRGETREALEALDRALDLTPFDKNPDGRYSLVFDRARLMPRDAGGAFLREEIGRMPAESVWATRAISVLAREWSDSVLPDDPLAWRQLAVSSEWYMNEETLLGVLADKAGADRIEAFWKHAEELAAADPMRRVGTLGEIAWRHKDFARTIALIEPVVGKMPAGETRDRTALTLFEASRDARDWERAHAIWPLARLRLGPREEVRWLGALARAQAEAGAVDEAMRTWTQAANLDRRELKEIPDLAKAGLRERLVVFYEEIAKRDPAAEPFVRRVLAGLKAP